MPRPPVPVTAERWRRTALTIRWGIQGLGQCPAIITDLTERFSVQLIPLGAALFSRRGGEPRAADLAAIADDVSFEC